MSPSQTSTCSITPVSGLPWNFKDVCTSCLEMNQFFSIHGNKASKYRSNKWPREIWWIHTFCSLPSVDSWQQLLCVHLDNFCCQSHPSLAVSSHSPKDIY